MPIKTGKTKETRCPACNGVLDHYWGNNDKDKPVAGDLTICSWCEAILEFNADLTLKRAPDEHIAQADPLQLNQSTSIASAIRMAIFQK